MDIVIPVRPGPNEELRYTLRSIHHNLPHNTIHLIGEPPAWVANVNVITRPRAGTKGHTVTGHLLAATTNPTISENFYLFNDDMYIREPVEEIPILNRGRVIDVLSRTRARHAARQPWKATLYTLTELVKAGYDDPYSFELHVPLPATKTILHRVLTDGEGKPGWDRRTVYGAYAGYSGRTIPDVKVYRRRDPIPEGPYLSSSDTAFPYVLRTLRRTLQTPSPYEHVSGPRRTRSINSWT